MLETLVDTTLVIKHKGKKFLVTENSVLSSYNIIDMFHILPKNKATAEEHKEVEAFVESIKNLKFS
jgi:hypothetical protein